MADQEELMARTSKPSETPVDFMADAPPARPYSEAISDEQKELMAQPSRREGVTE